MRTIVQEVRCGIIIDDTVIGGGPLAYHRDALARYGIAVRACRAQLPGSYDVMSQMTSESQDTQQGETDGPVSDTRRALIRKAAYSAPVLIALGSLSHIQIAAAQIGESGPPCQPGQICRRRASRR